MKTTKQLVFISLLLSCAFNQSNAQCNIVSGTSGTIQDSASTTSVSYTVAVSGAASFNNIPGSTLCGFTFPGISAPWSGNSDSLGTVTYTFSAPITSVNVFIAYVGTTGQTNPESFIFTTNSSVPVLTVDAGTCAAWTVMGNQITSPSVINALNSIATVSSVTPFTTLSIVSGTNSSVNGGSSYGLCDASLVTTLGDLMINPYKITIYPNPSSGKFEIDNKTSKKIDLEIYNLFGKKIFATNFNQQITNEIDLSNSPRGTYFVKIYDGVKIYKEKIVVQ